MITCVKYHIKVFTLFVVVLFPLSLAEPFCKDKIHSSFQVMTLKNNK